MEIATDVYWITENFPKSEIFGSTRQMRRATISVPSTINEGATRKNSREFIQGLHIALDSLAELETELEISLRLGYLEILENLDSTIIDIRRMILGLIRHLKK